MRKKMESLEQTVDQLRSRDTEVYEFRERHWAGLEKDSRRSDRANQEVEEWTQRLLKGGIETDSDYGIENALRLFHGQYHRMSVKMGIDPTIPDVLHLGHTVGLHKVRLFQQLGCHIDIVIGDAV
jgi:hypothetical protein